MLELEPSPVRCRSCFSIFSYLDGFCPVCGGTSFVSLEKPVVHPEAKPTPEDGGEKDLYLINEVSFMVNLSQKRIREYEKEGFIKPIREKNTNNRLYSEFEVTQIRQINSLIHDRGFTLACLRNFMVLAPCWNIFDCQKREQCPAFSIPLKPCYEVLQNPGNSNGRCIRCAIYLSRTAKKEKILNKPVSSKSSKNRP